MGAAHVAADVFLPEEQPGKDANQQPNGDLCENSLSARTVWGKLVLKLKELNLITLHTACGEIRNVKFLKNVLIVAIQEEYLFKMLTSSINLAKISELLKEIDSRIEVKFNKIEDKNKESKENLNKLKSLFGANLSVK